MAWLQLNGKRFFITEAGADALIKENFCRPKDGQTIWTVVPPFATGDSAGERFAEILCESVYTGVDNVE